MSVVLARLDTGTFDLDHVPRAIQLRARVDELTVPIGSIAVPFCGSYLGSYKVTLSKFKKELQCSRKLGGLGLGFFYGMSVLGCVRFLSTKPDKCCGPVCSDSRAFHVGFVSLQFR